MRITLKNIAKDLNLSVCTVSNALNDKGRLSKEKKREIISFAKEKGYLLNKNAKSLKNKVFGRVGIYIPRANYLEKSLFFCDLCSGALNALQGSNTQITLINAKGGDTEFDFDVDVDAALILEPEDSNDYLNKIKALKIPTILIGRPNKDDGTTPYVDSDTQFNSCLVGKHLLEYGHKNVLFVAGPAKLTYTVDCLNGWKNALSEYGLTFNNKDLINTCNFNLNCDFTQFGEKIKEKNYTAVICMSDMQTLSVLSYCKAHFIKVPDDLSIVCIGGTFATQMSNPAITAVDQQSNILGYEAVNMFLTKFSTGNKKIFKGDLTVRESTKRI